MNQVTHILVSGYRVVEPNPYYSINNKGIESETIENFKQEVTHFYTANEVKGYIEKYPAILDNKDARFYKVDEIKPTRSVVIDVSL